MTNRAEADQGAAKANHQNLRKLATGFLSSLAGSGSVGPFNNGVGDALRAMARSRWPYQAP
jgi:hypothetical protein